MLPPRERLTLADRWILTRLSDVVAETTADFNRYDFGIAADRLVKFGWYELCDWYLEATKAAVQRDTRAAVLSFALNVLVRLLHPIAPFITEAIWQSLPHDGDSIVTASWPETFGIPRDPEAVGLFATIVEAVERGATCGRNCSSRPRRG